MGMGFGLANIGGQALGGFTQGLMARDDRDIRKRKVAVEEGQLGVMQSRDKREQGQYEQGIGGDMAIGESLLADSDNIKNQGFYLDPNWSGVLAAGASGQYRSKAKNAMELGPGPSPSPEPMPTGFSPEPQPQDANAAIGATGAGGGVSVSARAKAGGGTGGPGPMLGKGVPVEKAPARQPGGMRSAESLISQANQYHSQIEAEVQKAKADLENAQATMSPERFVGYKKQRAADLAKRVTLLHAQGADLANKANEQIYNRVLDAAAASILNGQKNGTWVDEDARDKAAHYLKAFGYSDDDINDIKFIKRPGEGKDEIIIGGDRYTTGDLRTALVGSPEAKSNAINKFTGARVAMAQFERQMAVTAASADPLPIRMMKIHNTANEALEAAVRGGMAKWVPDTGPDGKPTNKGTGHYEVTDAYRGKPIETKIRSFENTRMKAEGFLTQKQDSAEAHSETVYKKAILDSLEKELATMQAPGSTYTPEEVAAKRAQVESFRMGLLQGGGGGGGRPGGGPALVDPLSPTNALF